MGGVYDIPICSPDKLRESPDDFVVLIIIYNDYLLKRIMRQLEDMGVCNYYPAAVWGFTNMIERYDFDGNRKYHELNTYKVIEENKDKIENVKSLLCDEKSVRLYESFVKKVKYNLKDYTDIADDIYEHLVMRFSDIKIMKF